MNAQEFKTPDSVNRIQSLGFTVGGVAAVLAVVGAFVSPEKFYHAYLFSFLLVLALTHAAANGLPGEHHFYITFRTDHPGVVIPPRLRAQYPQEMTIVLQHQFWDLKMDEEAGLISVGLTFGGTPASLVIPLEALTAFADPAVRFGMGLSMADALAKLGAVDHVAVGLADFGKPEGFLERQVPRWLSELDSYSEYDGYPGPEIPGIEQVAGWLEANRPTKWTPGIMHGDYHAANVMFSRTGPEVVAIVDWEMCTIGDPLLDLGWLLATWRQPDGTAVFSHALGGQDGLASIDDLFQRYAANTTRDLSHITWYTVLACFKLGIVIEGTLARAFAGKAEKAVGDQLHAATVHLFERALGLIEAE